MAGGRAAAAPSERVPEQITIPDKSWMNISRMEKILLFNQLWLTIISLLVGLSSPGLLFLLLQRFAADKEKAFRKRK